MSLLSCAKAVAGRHVKKMSVVAKNAPKNFGRLSINIIWTLLEERIAAPSNAPGQALTSFHPDTGLVSCN